MADQGHGADQEGQRDREAEEEVLGAEEDEVVTTRRRQREFVV